MLYESHGCAWLHLQVSQLDEQGDRQLQVLIRHSRAMEAWKDMEPQVCPLQHMCDNAVRPL